MNTENIIDTIVFTINDVKRTLHIKQMPIIPKQPKKDENKFL